VERAVMTLLKIKREKKVRKTMESSFEARRAPITSMLEKYLKTLKNTRKLPNQKSKPIEKNMMTRRSLFFSSCLEEFL